MWPDLKKTGVCLMAGIVFPAMAIAQDEDEALTWSVSPLVGAHSPVLELINERATKSPLLGTGEIRAEPDDENAGFNETIAFGFENPLDEIGTNTNVGVEFQWRQSDKHTFLFGASTWEGVSQGITAGQMPIQGSMRNVDYERRMKVSYNEYYLGWQYTFARKPDSYRFYSRISMNEVFDLDYREEHVFSIKGGELDTVKRIINVTGQTTGVLGFQFGAGGNKGNGQ